MSARYSRHCWPGRIQVGGVDGVCVCLRACVLHYISRPSFCFPSVGLFECEYSSQICKK